MLLISCKTSLKIFNLLGAISLTLFVIKDLASSFIPAHDLHSNSYRPLWIAILYANGA